ncbi:MAG: hypothetical protein QXJ68_01680 [Methanocellales archaeon]
MYLEANLSLENIFHAITLLSIALLSSGHKIYSSMIFIIEWRMPSKSSLSISMFASFSASSGSCSSSAIQKAKSFGYSTGRSGQPI